MKNEIDCLSRENALTGYIVRNSAIDSILGEVRRRSYQAKKTKRKSEAAVESGKVLRFVMDEMRVITDRYMFGPTYIVNLKLLSL